MKVISLPVIVNTAFKYVINTSNKYNIDESHSLKHSMEVFKYANNILKAEKDKYPIVEEQKDIIFISSIIHDMCDKKYMDEKKGIDNIKKHFKEFLPQEKIDVVGAIISSMSYSKVKLNGFPDLGEYQVAYNIVRESDLLSSYDIDRCIIYGIHRENLEYLDAINRAEYIFDNRVLNYIKDNLFLTEYSKYESLNLHMKALINLKELESLKKNIFL
jgi:HD superfamily phosphodiesterase